MAVSTRGASVTFDCARGRISQELTLDSNRQFQVAGTYSPNQSAPISSGPALPVNIPATYQGTLTSATEMDLDLILAGTNGSTIQQTYHLTYGMPGTLELCISPL